MFFCFVLLCFVVCFSPPQFASEGIRSKQKNFYVNQAIERNSIDHRLVVPQITYKDYSIKSDTFDKMRCPLQYATTVFGAYFAAPRSYESQKFRLEMLLAYSLAIAI